MSRLEVGLLVLGGVCAMALVAGEALRRRKCPPVLPVGQPRVACADDGLHYIRFRGTHRSLNREMRAIDFRTT